MTSCCFLFRNHPLPHPKATCFPWSWILFTTSGNWQRPKLISALSSPGHRVWLKDPFRADKKKRFSDWDFWGKDLLLPAGFETGRVQSWGLQAWGKGQSLFELKDGSWWHHISLELSHTWSQSFLSLPTEKIITERRYNHSLIKFET